MRLVGEAEIGGLHSEGENHQNQRHVGVHVGNDTIAPRGCRKLGSLERNQQIVQESADDARKAIDGRILRDVL